MRWSHSNFVPFNFGMKSASRSQPSILTHSEHCSNSRHTPSSSFSGFKLLSDNSSEKIGFYKLLPVTSEPFPVREEFELILTATEIPSAMASMFENRFKRSSDFGFLLASCIQ